MDYLAEHAGGGGEDADVIQSGSEERRGHNGGVRAPQRYRPWVWKSLLPSEPQGADEQQTGSGAY